MRILRNGSERQIRKLAKRREKLLKKAIKAAERRETAKFKCDHCGCTFEMVRGEYTLTNATLYVDSIGDLGSVVEAKCPFCGVLLESVIEEQLMCLTFEDLKHDEPEVDEVRFYQDQETKEE